MADSKDNSGVMEVVAIAALAFFLWWITRKKVIYIGEPSTTEPEVKDQFSGDPDFNMNDYCQNVVHKPLSTNDLTTSSLLGDGWCFRGDRSAIDESKGFGDAYAEEQADKYVKMKQEEAILIKNKLCVQFRLINSTSSPITTNLLNTTQNSNPFNPIPAIPVAAAATGVGENGFTANWSSAVNAAGYYIDIATDISFLSYVSGYLSKDVGNVITLIVSGIGAGTTYYYRLKAYNNTGESEYSDIITVTTDFIEDEDGNQYSSVIVGSQEWMKENLKTTKYADGTAIPNLTGNQFNDWFLASTDEFTLVYTNIYLYGLGGLGGTFYWTSSEVSATQATRFNITTGASGNENKTANINLRPVRSFVSADVYALRDTGPAGGLIFHIIDNGDGTYTYYELSLTVFSQSPWSNVTSELIGTTGTAVGTGQTNTTAIINQSGGSDDWFLPSKDELNQIYTELYLFGVGGLSNGSYWSSSEYDATNSYYQNFASGIAAQTLKDSYGYIRACRAFTAGAGAYSLRDVGPSGGLIFYVSGTSYLEAAPVDQSANFQWSSVTGNLIGTTATAIGTGLANTNAIVGQAGHTFSAAQECLDYDNTYIHTGSAAKICDDLDEGGWANDTSGAYCWYDNDIAYESPYGALYNQPAVVNASGLAPTGWRIPTQSDWGNLIDELGGDAVAGGKLKEIGITHWNNPNVDATDEIGFAAVGAGLRNDSGAFMFINAVADYWTSTSGSRVLIQNSAADATLFAGTDTKYGFSVRCMRDI